MRSWFRRGAVLLSLVAMVPLSRWLQRLLSDDGEISTFAVNHAVAALPTLVGFAAISMLIWWSRTFYTKEKVVLSVCLCIAIFGVLNFSAEILLASTPRSDNDKNAHRAPYPFIQFKGSAASAIHNRLGYGGAVPEPAKRKGEYRIFFVGGSTVRFGDPPIPALVERMFWDEGFEEVRVFNFGVSGSNTGMELARLVFEIPPHQPDMVVSYSGGNDITLPVWMDPRPGYPYNFMVYENHPLYADDYPTAALTAYGSHLLRLLGKSYFKEKFSKREQLRGSSDWNTQVWREQIVRQYVRNLEVSAKVARAFDSQFAAFLQPVLISKRTMSRQEREYLDATAVRGRGPDTAELRAYFDFVRDGINSRMLAEDRQVQFQFTDLSRIYDATETPIFADFIHTGQDARMVVARRMFEKLRAMRVEDR